MQGRSVAIGVDLGTTNSVVAIYDGNGIAHIIKDDDEPSMPSYVHYNGTGEPEVGLPAYEERHLDPENTVHSVKQIIGRSFNDKVVAGVIARKSWAFPVNAGPNGECRICVPAAGGEGHDPLGLRPEDVSAAVLRQLVANARKTHAVHAAVITVPATFGDGQRRATEEAAKLAGIHHVKLMNEPSAAAFAYVNGVLQPASHARHVLVFDLGGGTLDVAVLYIPADCSLTGSDRSGSGSGDHMRIKAVAADLTLGGDVFTQQLTQHCLNRLKALGVDPSCFDLQPELGVKLWDACEKAKKLLSRKETATLDMASVLSARLPQKIVLTREDFEQLCAPTFDQIRRPLDEVLAAVDEGLDPMQIDMVLLVGRATRMPRIRNLLATYFRRGPNVLSQGVDEAEAVATGAAIMAERVFNSSKARSSRNGSLVEPKLHGMEILAKGFSIVCRDGRCYNMIKPNSAYPIKKSQYFEKQRVTQDVISISVVEGDWKRVEEETPLVGHFMVSGLRLLPKGVDVTLSVNDSGILEVTAVARDDPSREGHLCVTRSDGDGWRVIPPPGGQGGQWPRPPEQLQRLRACRLRVEENLRDARAQDCKKDILHWQQMLAVVEDQIRGGGGPITDKWIDELEELVRMCNIAVTAWSTMLPRFGVADF